MSQPAAEKIWTLIQQNLRLQAVAAIREAVPKAQAAKITDVMEFVIANRDAGRWLFFRRLHRKYGEQLLVVNPFDFFVSSGDVRYGVHGNHLEMKCPRCDAPPIEFIPLQVPPTMEDMLAAAELHIRNGCG